MKRIKKECKLCGHVGSVKALAITYNTSPERIRVIHGEDWYYIYSSEETEIHVHDLARGKLRFDDEQMIGSVEMGRGFDSIVLESIREDKVISAELREDTSYIQVLELMERGLIEQVGDDVTFEFGNQSEYDDYYDYYDETDDFDDRDSDDYYEEAEISVKENDYYSETVGENDGYHGETASSNVVSREEQKAILARKDEIRRESAKKENTTMHRFSFRPTEKYKRILKNREKQENRNSDKTEIGERNEE